MHKKFPGLLLSALLLGAPAVAQEQLHAGHGGGCASFGWNIDGELALLAGPATALVAGDGSAEVRIRLGVPYKVSLHPQAQVKLAARPGKPMLSGDANGGLLSFRVPVAGRYRVSISTGHWIDVVDGGKAVASLDFRGRHNCPLLHKVVLYELPAGRDLQLQFAGGNAAQAGVLITPAPAVAP